MKIITPPEIEPVTLDEMNKHLRVLTNDEDVYVESLIKAARVFCEKDQNRAYLKQQIEIVLDDFPQRVYSIIPSPALSFESIRYFDHENREYYLENDHYIVDLASDPARLAIKKRPSVHLRKIGGVILTFWAGYGEKIEDVPQDIKHAIKLLTGHFFENRENTSVIKMNELPFSVKALLDHERIIIL